MNELRELSFIGFNGKINVYTSLLTVLLHDLGD
jgi:hypothetical protein